MLVRKGAFDTSGIDLLAGEEFGSGLRDKLRTFDRASDRHFDGALVYPFAVFHDAAIDPDAVRAHRLDFSNVRKENYWCRHPGFPRRSNTAREKCATRCGASASGIQRCPEIIPSIRSSTDATLSHAVSKRDFVKFYVPSSRPYNFSEELR